MTSLAYLQRHGISTNVRVLLNHAIIMRVENVKMKPGTICLLNGTTCKISFSLHTNTDAESISVVNNL